MTPKSLRKVQEHNLIGFSAAEAYFYGERRRRGEGVKYLLSKKHFSQILSWKGLSSFNDILPTASLRVSAPQEKCLLKA